MKCNFLNHFRVPIRSLVICLREFISTDQDTRTESESRCPAYCLSVMVSSSLHIHKLIFLIRNYQKPFTILMYMFNDSVGISIINRSSQIKWITLLYCAWLCCIVIQGKYLCLWIITKLFLSYQIYSTKHTCLIHHLNYLILS